MEKIEALAYAGLLLIPWVAISWIVRRANRRAEYHETIIDRLVQIRRGG